VLHLLERREDDTDGPTRSEKSVSPTLVTKIVTLLEENVGPLGFTEQLQYSRESTATD